MRNLRTKKLHDNIKENVGGGGKNCQPMKKLPTNVKIANQTRYPPLEKKAR